MLLRFAGLTGATIEPNVFAEGFIRPTAGLLTHRRYALEANPHGFQYLASPSLPGATTTGLGIDAGVTTALTVGRWTIDLAGTYLDQAVLRSFQVGGGAQLPLR